MATKLIIIRHGATDWNIENRYQGHKDMPLNEVGRAQVLQLADQLANENVDVVYSSDLTRAIQTADLIFGQRGIPIYKTDRLRECNFGTWEGFTMEELKEKVPQEVAAFQADPINFVSPHGESRNQMARRVTKMIEEIVHTHPNKTIAIVTHDGPIAAIMTYVTGEGMTARNKYRIDNASYHIVEYDNEKNKWRIVKCGTKNQN